MLKSILKRAGVGFLIGMFVGNAIAFLTENSDTNGVTFASKQLLDKSKAVTKTVKIKIQ